MPRLLKIAKMVYYIVNLLIYYTYVINSIIKTVQVVTCCRVFFFTSLSFTFAFLHPISFIFSLHGIAQCTDVLCTRDCSSDF